MVKLDQEKLNWLFKQHYALLAFIFIIAWNVIGVLLFSSIVEMDLFLYLVWLTLGLLAFEGISRLLLRWSIGENYSYWLYGYCLIDHEKYGFRFRPSVSTDKIEFPIFDRVAFPAGSQPALDLPTNRAQRLKFTTNSMGFRGKGFDPNVKKRKLRMFCIGGSTTACGLCGDEETWPFKLQGYLDGKSCDVEVINAGTLGWASYQEYLLVRDELVAYKPDIILLHEGWNEEFIYSSLGLGKAWSPGTIRNVRESYNLYTNPNSLLSSTKSVAFSLATQDIYRNILFARNMSFENRARWNMLRESEYLQAWFDNMVSIARIAKERNVLTFVLDYPGLTNIADFPQHREKYVQNTRLTHRYADYQAISKKRISSTLEHIEPIIHCLKVDNIFDDIVGEARLDMFNDEIHLSAAGNDLFARYLSELLLQDPQFNGLYRGNSLNPREIPGEGRISDIRKAVGVNPGYLERLIDRNYHSAKPAAGGIGSLVRPPSVSEIPQTRYTTW